MTGSQIAVLVLAGMGASFLVGLGIGESRSERREEALRSEGLAMAALPAPRAEIKCGKQAVREYLNACAVQKRMEAVK